MSSLFRLPVPTRIAMGFDEEAGYTKPQEDINADLDYNDLALEQYVSDLGITATSTGTWVSDSATLAGAGWTVGNGTVNAQHIEDGAQVTYTVIFTIGSTTGFGSGLGFSLPSTPQATPLPVQTTIWDSSANVYYGGTGHISSTFAFPATSSVGGVQSSLTSTIPVAFSTGDIVAICTVYRKA